MRTIAAAVLVVLVVLVCALALLLRRYGGFSLVSAPVVGGGDTYSDQWQKIRTWPELRADTVAMGSFMIDRRRVLSALGVIKYRRPPGVPAMKGIDWGKLHKELLPLAKKEETWFGNINIVPHGDKFKAVVVHKVRDGEDAPSAFKEMSDTPSMLSFHTAPGDTCASMFPTGQDYALSVVNGYGGRFAANIVVSKYGLVAYGLNGRLIRHIWDGIAPDYQSFLSYLQSLVELQRIEMEPHRFQILERQALRLGFFTKVLHAAPDALGCGRAEIVGLDAFDADIDTYKDIAESLVRMRENYSKKFPMDGDEFDAIVEKNQRFSRILSGW